MFTKVNGACILSIVVKSKTGDKISNDVPYCVIQNTETKQYYNGLFFEDSETHLQMKYVADGTYTYSFTPEEVADFKIFIKSEKYEISKIIELTSYSENSIPSYEWRVDSVYSVSVPYSDVIKDCACKIQQESTGLFWNGNEWCEESVALKMNLVQNSLWIYEFTPKDTGMYIITTVNSSGENIYGLNVTDKALEDESPVLVSSSSLRFEDGTNCVCMSNKEEKLRGVVISAYNKKTKELVGKTLSLKDGSWSLILPHGVYIFTFAKKNYSSVSFERSV